jgi:hypothetical protein
VSVIFRATEDIGVGDWIYIYQSGPEKHAPWMYGGFAGGANAEKRPPLSKDTTIKVAAPVDGSGVAGADTSLQATLDLVAGHIRTIQGTDTWRDAPGTSLAALVTWREPVETAAHLPSTGNRPGDVRIVLNTGTIYLWGASGWRSPAGGSVSTAAATAVVTVGSFAIGAFTLVALLADGAVAASALSPSHAGRVVGITLESAGAGDDVLVQLGGDVVLSSAPTTQGAVFVGAGGALSTTLVTGAIFAQAVGVVVGSRLFLSVDPSVAVLESAHLPSATPGYVPVDLAGLVAAEMSSWGYAANLGDGVATLYTVNHELGSVDVQTEVRSLVGEVVYPLVTVTGLNAVDVYFAQPPSVDAYRVTVRRVV